MSVRPLACFVLALALAACAGSKDSTTAPAAVTTSTVTLGPAVATDTYRPSGLPASWTGFCPVASPSTVTITAGNAYQVVNQTGRAVDIVTVANRTPVETIAVGATGVKHIEYGAVSQATFTFPVTVAGCTDITSGQGILNITVNSR